MSVQIVLFLFCLGMTKRAVEMRAIRHLWDCDPVESEEETAFDENEESDCDEGLVVSDSTFQMKLKQVLNQDKVKTQPVQIHWLVKMAPFGQKL